MRRKRQNGCLYIKRKGENEYAFARNLEQKGLIQMTYKSCSVCGGEVIDGKPHFIPLGADSVLKIIDQECMNCGCAIIGENQKTEIIKNRDAHDALVSAMENRFKINNR